MVDTGSGTGIPSKRPSCARATQHAGNTLTSGSSHFSYVFSALVTVSIASSACCDHNTNSLVRGPPHPQHNTAARQSARTPSRIWQ